MRDLDIEALATELVKYFDGWVVVPHSGDTCEHRSQFVNDEGMKFDISRDWHHKDRLNVQTWNWPKFVKWENGKELTEMVTPSSLYTPKEEAPSISCALSKGAEKIAKDILRRFLPDYTRIYSRCKERADAYTQSNTDARIGWVKLCTFLNKSPNHNMHYVGETIQVENRSGSVQIKVDANYDNAKLVLMTLRHLHEFKTIGQPE